MKIPKQIEFSYIKKYLGHFFYDVPSIIIDSTL